MLDKIIHFSIHNKLVIGLFTVALIAWGSYSLSQLPIDAVPDITNNQVQVLTISPTLAAQEVERLITYPVEVIMATIPDIEEVRSFSRLGLSVVTIVFKDEVDIYFARQQVFERLQQAQSQIPAGVGIPELAPVTTGLGEIYQYVLRTKPGYESKYSAMELRSIQDWIVRRGLLGTTGVADVSSFGGYLKQYEIALDPQKIRGMNLSISEIFDALKKNNQNTGGAYIDKNPSSFFIRSEGLIESLDDIGNIVVKNTENGSPVLIRDVATIQYGHAIRYGAMTHNVDGEVTGGIILMLKGANSSEVITNVKERIAAIEKTLPEGVRIEPFLDRTKLVNHAISTVVTNLAEGALIVIFVLVLMLGNLRAGLIVASVIPLSMLFAVSLMNIFGVSGNLMSLGAIDFGLIVDGAVIIVESTLHHIATSGLTGRLTRQQMNEEVESSAKKMMSAAAFGQIIILIVYLPLLALVGVEGKMFRPMAQVVSFAILGAFILSLTYVPMVSALLLSKKTQRKRNISDKIMAVFQRVYTPMIHFALRRKLLVIIASLVLFISSLIIFLNMGGEFIPTLDEGDFAIETRLMTGSSLSQTIEAAQKGSQILASQFPEVEQVVAKIGSAEIPVDPMPQESCDLIVILKDRDEWTSAETREELAEKMANALATIPGVTFGFQQPIQMRFNELMTGARQDVVLKIYGEDLNVLASYAEKVARLINPVQGVEDMYVEQVTGLPQISVKFNRNELARFGLNIDDVNRVIRTGFAGETAGVVYEGEKRYDLVVRLNQQNRRDIEDVRNLFVTTPEGNQIPLTQVADIQFKEGPNQIQRDDTKRRIIVGFNVRNRDVESIIAEIQQKVNGQIQFPAGYSVSYGGAFENLIEARNRLSIAVPVALLLIFVLLYFTFRSVVQSVLIFTAIPLSAIGGIFALWLRGMPFSISAGVGFIALFGVAVLNGIVLIAYFNQLKKEGLTDVREIILKGTSMRLRPVIMTAMVASLGFLPMALSNSSGAEVQKPLATVVIGGLVSATLLTLLVLPVLYSLAERIHIRSFNRLRPGSSAIAVLTGLLMCASLQTKAQAVVQKVNLQEAIQLALQNNERIKSATYEVEAQKTLKATAFDPGKTNFHWMRGQYNSIRTDNNFTITQDIPFPGNIPSQLNLYRAEVSSRESALAMARNELIRDVKNTYNQLTFIASRQQLLLQQDSLFTGFVKAASVRFRTGETNQLEKVSAESQLFEVKNWLLQNESDYKIVLAQFRILLNHSQPVDIVETRLVKNNFPIPADTVAAIQSNPALTQGRQQIEVGKRTEKVIRNRLLPDFSLGYFNQSLIGFQNATGTEQYYGPDKRFTGFQVGMAFPLWFRPYTARISAAQTHTKIATSKTLVIENQLRSQYEAAIGQYTKFQTSLAYYESNALPTADLILSNALKAFQAGEIGYVEYLNGLNRALTIRTNYLSLLHQYNQAAIDVEFLMGNRQ
jgi:heavy metal efflux system protein